MSVSPMIAYEPAPQPDDIAIVRAGLSAYNRLHAPEDTFEPLTLFVRDAQGTVVGGLLGGTIWSWLYVEILWLSVALRGRGYGSRGYTAFGVLENFPPGHRKYFLQKPLV